MNVELKQAMKGTLPATPEGNLDAIERGDRGWLIEHNIPMVIAQVNRHIKKWRSHAYLLDDLISAGHIALIQGVDKLLEGERAVPEAYLRAKINGAIKDCIDNELGEGMMSKSTVFNRRRSNQPIPAKSYDIAHLEDPWDANDLRSTFNSLYAAGRDDADEVIVQMRAKGYKDPEIGRTLNLSQQQIRERRKNIEERYDSQDCST
jgi:hypothetical protein